MSPRCAEELLLGVYDEYEDYCSEKGLDRGECGQGFDRNGWKYRVARCGTFIRNCRSRV